MPDSKAFQDRLDEFVAKYAREKDAKPMASFPEALDLSKIKVSPPAPKLHPEPVGIGGCLLHPNHEERLRRAFATGGIVAAGAAQEHVLMGGRRLGKSEVVANMLKARKDMGLPKSLRGTSTSTMIVDELLHDDMRDGITSGIYKQHLERLMAKQQPQALGERAKLELFALAEKLTDYFKAHTAKTSLLSPMQITVSTRGKGYRKLPAMGGEEFIITRARIGAQSRGSQLIFELAPTFATDWQHAEMEMQPALSSLENMRSILNAAVDGDFIARLEAIRDIDDEEARQKEVQERATEYGEFGTW